MTLVLNHNFIAALCANRLRIEGSDCVVSEDLAVHCSPMETGGQDSHPDSALEIKVLRTAAMRLYYGEC